MLLYKVASFVVIDFENGVDYISFSVFDFSALKNGTEYSFVNDQFQVNDYTDVTFIKDKSGTAYTEATLDAFISTIKVIDDPNIGNLPAGGTTGQILAKIDGTDYNAEWIDNLLDEVNPVCKLGENISKGQAVYISGADGTNKVIKKASNATELTSSKTFGLLSASGVTNNKIRVITTGYLSGLDTSSANEGDPVWLGVNGNLIYGIANKPHAPAHLVFIGFVVRKNNVNGQIYVRVQNGFELDELHDVKIQSPANKNTIFYNSSNSLWENRLIGIADVTDLESALSGKEPTINAGTTSQYWRGDKSWQTLDKSAVGLGNVDNTSDLNKPISTATQTALNAKQDSATAINTSNIGAQSVAYAASAGNADTLDGYHASAFQMVLTNPITGTGTTNYVSKFTASGTIGNSLIFDNGSSVGIGTTTPFRQLDVNGALRLQTGTIDFGNSVNNQIWVASNNINFKTNGSEKAIITSGGYFGVGTSSPSSILHLSGLTTLLTITDNTYGRTSNIGYLDQANLYFANDSNSNTYIGRYNNLFLAYGGGSVGIGTENPLQKLHVNGNILLPVTNSLYFVPTLTTYGIGTPNSSGVQIFTGAGDYIRFGHMSGVDNFTERMRVDGNGNIGIGTTSPAYQLSIEKFGNTYNINPHLAGVDLHSTGNIAPHYQTTYDWYTGAIGSGSFKMRLTNSGDLGIGTTNPQAKLDVLNKVLIGEDLTFGGYYGIGWGSLQNGYNRIFAQSLGGSGDGLFLASASGKGIYFRPNGGSTDALTIAANNYIGINTVAPTYPIHLNNPGSETGILTTFGSANIYLSHGGWGMGANKFGIGNGSFPSIVINGSNENVGIGTTNPIWKFVVSKGGAAGLEIDPDNGSPGYVGVYSYNRASGSYYPLLFQAANYYLTIGSVGIGTTTIDPSAILQLESTTQGFLPPRMDNSEISAISNPAEGLIVYSTQSKCLFLFDGASWQKIAYA